MAHSRVVSAIRHIACPLATSSWFATGEWERAVDVWSTSERSRVSSFETILDPGGRRLAALGEDRPVVVAGAYNRYGVRGYDAATGQVLWQRTDLKRVQSLDPLPERRVAAGFDDRSLHVLDGDTGETLVKIRAIEQFYARSDRPIAIGVGHSGSGWFGLYDLENFKRLWKEESSFTILHAALGADSVSVAEVGGAVRCLDYDGIERWRWSPPAGEHVERLAWNSSGAFFCGVLHPYETKRSPAALITFDDHGDIAAANQIADAMEYEFTADGEALVLSTLDAERYSEGVVLSVSSADVVWRFRSRVPLTAEPERSR
jgi:hypothetical protein